MRITVEEVERIIKQETGECRCDEIYRNRWVTQPHLTDPLCAWHEYGKWILDGISEFEEGT